MEKYQGITVERINEMSKEEKASYYGEIYQFVGSLIGVFAEVNSVNGLDDATEHFVYSGACNLFEGLLDNLAALVSLQDDLPT